MANDALPVQQQNISSSAPTLKTVYPGSGDRKLDPYGLTYRKGHRTQGPLAGGRPIFRTPARRMR